MEELSVKLKKMKQKSNQDRLSIQSFAKEDPLKRTRHYIRLKVSSTLDRRMAIVKKVPLFAGKSEDTYVAMCTTHLEEVEYKENDHIIVQGDIGDAFYILDSGLLSVRKSSLVEPAKEVDRLKPGAFFGEIALLTEEVRAASIVVISPSAICLRMTKAVFKKMTADIEAKTKVVNSAMARTAVEKVELLRSLSADTKKSLVEALAETKFPASTLICEQGTVGNTFYILIEGECDVTVRVEGSKQDRFISTLMAGEYFGVFSVLLTSYCPRLILSCHHA